MMSSLVRISPDGASPLAAYKLGVNHKVFGVKPFPTILHYGPPAQVPRTADAGGPYTVDEGGSVTLDGSGSFDPDGYIVLYEWDLDNDGQYDDATGATTDAVFDDNGCLIVGLRVTDEFGASDTDVAEVTVNNVAPTVGPISAPIDPVAVGTSVTASADFTDPGVLDSHTALCDWQPCLHCYRRLCSHADGDRQ
jgi:hypothetical protein